MRFQLKYFTLHQIYYHFYSNFNSSHYKFIPLFNNKKRRNLKSLKNYIENIKTSKYSLSILSYNILADAYCEQQWFYYCDKAYLDYDYRKKLILEQLKYLKPDIICLEEVDMLHYNEYYEPKLRDIGYSSLYFKKANAKPDGIATFWNQELFDLNDKIQFYFQDNIGESIIENKHLYYKNIKYFFSGAGVLGVTLLHKSNFQKLTVFNTHLFWNPQFEYVKFFEISQILQYIYKNFKQYDNIFICGDLNSIPHSNVFNLIQNQLNQKSITVQFGFQSEINQNLMKFLHRLYFLESRNSYEPLVKIKNFYTNYSQHFKGVLDYQFYNVNANFKPILLLNCSNKEILTKHVAIPNQYFPSDHLPLMTYFKLKKQNLQQM